MKGIMARLKRDRLIYLFIPIGLLLIIFPNYVSDYISYILGSGMVIYGVISVILCIRFPDSERSLGNSIIKMVTGIIILLLNSDSVPAVGIIWGMQSLEDVAMEIDDCRKTRKISIISIVAMACTLFFAGLLIMYPSARLEGQIRWLGIEMIGSTFIHQWNRLREKKMNNTDEYQK